MLDKTIKEAYFIDVRIPTDATSAAPSPRRSRSTQT